MLLNDFSISYNEFGNKLETNWQQKISGPNNICNKNKISAKKRQNLNNIFKDIFGLAEFGL